MLRTLPLLGLLALAACGDGQPLFDEEAPGVPGAPPDDGGGDGVDGDGLPPGTESPSAGGGIVRREALDDAGGGYVEDVAYDAATDTFTVDNLAFDGLNVYTRDRAVGTLSGDGPAVYAVYEAADVVVDETGAGVLQLEYRAIYGVSANEEDGEPATRFAIVRTGSYVDYGFGGFVYQREGGVDLPATGQAAYAGDYAGMRVFNGRTGLEYTRGDMEVAIDFEDFNDGAGVQGVVFNREAFDIDGNPIPVGDGEGELPLPEITFDVGPGVVTANGEISGTLQSYEVDEGGALATYEAGSYYAIVAGEDAEEVVGVFVVESEDPRFSGVTAQETGGFIVYR